MEKGLSLVIERSWRGLVCGEFRVCVCVACGLSVVLGYRISIRYQNNKDKIG